MHVVINARRCLSLRFSLALKTNSPLISAPRFRMDVSLSDTVSLCDFFKM